MPPRKQPTSDSDTSAKNEDIEHTAERIIEYIEPRLPTKEPKVKDAEDFSGLDRGQLRPFLAQCKLVFFAQPTRYATDNAKVYYIASHFKDTALAWWQQQFDLEPMPPWISDYGEFLEKFREMFGEIDEEGKAERAIRSLDMKGTQSVEGYVVEFRRLAGLTRWNESALASQFYSGLPRRLKNDLARLPEGRPRSLTALEKITLRMDQHYWEYQEDLKIEQHRISLPPSPSSTFSAARGTTPPITNPLLRTPTPRTLGKQPTHTDSSGRLTAAERLRRFENNLCMYCGEAGHRRDNCPKGALRPQRVREVITEEVPAEQGKEEATQ
jgi:ferredoxin